MAERNILSDNKRIKQVLINLISNSFKFTERGRIEIKIGEFKRNGDNFLKFEVSDTGVGISKEDIPKLFKMFGMLSKHRSQLNQSGSCIGLSISKKIVESLGGKINVRSRENEWTKFTFTIKLSKEESVSEEELISNSIEENIVVILEESKFQNAKVIYLVILSIYIKII